MKSLSPRRTGFTLVELLVVMGIVAMLAAMLMPALWKSITKVREASTLMEIKNIETAMMAFRLDFGFYPPDKRILAVKRVVFDEPTATYMLVDVDLDLVSPECLVFYLGTKFHPDPQPIVDHLGYVGSVEVFGEAINAGPYYDFQSKRLWKGDDADQEPVYVDKLGEEGRDACFYRFRNNEEGPSTDLGVAGYKIYIRTLGVDIWSPGLDGIDCIFDHPDKLDTVDPATMLTKEDLPGWPEYIDVGGAGVDTRVDEITNW